MILKCKSPKKNQINSFKNTDLFLQKLFFMKSVALYVIFLLILLFSACKKKEYLFISGNTMGTSYHIKYYSSEKLVLHSEIDSVLKAVNQSLSTYIQSSVISKFNQSSDSVEVDSFFKYVFLLAKEVWKKSDGAFDPTVMPLVNAFGFGFEKIDSVSKSAVDSLKQFVGFENVRLKGNYCVKTMPGLMLDFSAIAKGFGVDCVALFLESKNVINYMVEIGGEVRVKGKNPKGKYWQIAIEKPAENTLPGEVYDTVFPLKNYSLATSGNYRNFYIKDGVKYAHTIDPKTGYPVFNDLLSASVFYKNCTEADAWATAFMVLGKDKSVKVLKKNPEIAVFFICKNENNTETYFSSENLKKITAD